MFWLRCFKYIVFAASRHEKKENVREPVLMTPNVHIFSQYADRFFFQDAPTFCIFLTSRIFIESNVMAS